MLPLPPHRAAGPHLHPLLLQVDAVRQVLSGDDVRVLVLVEKRFQGLQLVLGEYGAMAACAALDLLESLQLARAALGTPAGSGCRVKQPHGPGEPGVCKERDGQRHGDKGLRHSPGSRQAGTDCIHTCEVEGAQLASWHG